MRNDIEIDWNNMPYWEVTQTWNDTLDWEGTTWELLDWENNTEWVDFGYIPSNDSKVTPRFQRKNTGKIG